MIQKAKKFNNKSYIIAILAGVALISGIVVTNAAQTSQLGGATTNNIVNDKTSTPTAQAQLASPPQLTGKLSLYILPLDNGQRYKSGEVVDQLKTLLPNMLAAHFTQLGASPQGAYSIEKVQLTEQNITEDLKGDGFKVGDVVEMAVFKSADTVKIYIDPAVKKPDGTPVTVSDLSPEYEFGNGASCCGFWLKDGTYVAAAFFVVDQTYDQAVTERLPTIKTTVSGLVDATP